MYCAFWNAKENGIEQTFKDIAKDILAHGLVSNPRGKQTKQCIGATIRLNPNDTMIRNKQRKMNYIFSLIQKLVYTSGNGLYSGILDWYNSNYSYYEDGIDIGNYCWRIMPQLRKVVNTLKQDTFSRQAIISIYNNLYDQRVTKDVPCTLSLQFLIRNNKLNMIVNMRSNDLLWGFSYDINQFAYIQKLIAMILGIQAGTYIHNAGSLHIYDYSYESFDKIINCSQLNQQVDSTPLYTRSIIIQNENRILDCYFQDTQRFWKYQGLVRFGQQKTQELSSVKFKQESGFFNNALRRLNEYNTKKIIDKTHTDKYFKTI